VSTCDEHTETVIKFLDSGCCSDQGMLLKDIDITQDITGTFHKSTVIEYLLETLEFRLQGDSDSIPMLQTRPSSTIIMQWVKIVSLLCIL